MAQLTAILIGSVVGYCLFAITSLYLHRGLCHRSFEMCPPVRFASGGLLWLTLGLNSEVWIRVHEKHHSVSDTAEDPHSPRVFGLFHVLFLTAIYYHRAGLPYRPQGLRRWTRGSFICPLGLAVIIVVLFPVSIGLSFMTSYMLTYLLLQGVVNSFGHSGLSTTENAGSAVNIKCLSWLTAGESLHQVHHAHPGRYDFGEGSVGLDPVGSLIRGLIALKMAQVPTVVRR